MALAMLCPPTRQNSRRAWIGIAAIVLVALGLRWFPSTRLLPHNVEPDAYVVQLAQDFRGDPALVQHTDYAERYPVLLARVLACLPWPSPDVDPSRPGATDRMLCAGAGPYQAGRWLVLAISLALIPGTWLAARRISGERVAWIASALVATSMVHALFSTQARPHAPQAAIAIFAVWSAMRVAERPSMARCALAVILASLSLSTLQIGAATLPPLALAAWLAGGTIVRRVGRVILLPVLAAITAAWAYPFALNVRENGLRLGGKGAHEVDFSAADLTGFGELVRRLAEHDPVLLVLLAGGVASLVLRWRASGRALATSRDIAVACGYVLPYLCVVGPLNEVFERFLLPLLPWITILSAALIVRLAGDSLRRATVFGAIAVAIPFLLVLDFAVISARPDSSTVVARWIESHPEAREARIALSPGLVLPAAFDAESLVTALEDRAARSTPWPKYQSTRSNAEFPTLRLKQYLVPGRLAQKPEEGLAAWFDGVNPRFVVLERSKKNLFLAGGRELSEIVRARGTLLLRTEGEAPGILDAGLLHYQTMDRFVPRLLRTHRFGAALEVWRIDR